VTNALAYFVPASVTKKNSFMTNAKVLNVIRLFFSVSGSGPKKTRTFVPYKPLWLSPMLAKKS
jgi:hypothetical protein